MFTRKLCIKLHKNNSCHGIKHVEKCSNAKSVTRHIVTQATWGETNVITQVETYYSVTCALLGGSTVSMCKRQETGGLHANTVKQSL